MNQNPEQLAHDNIDQMLLAAGWAVQARTAFNLQAAKGVAIREWTTSEGPADYVLFVAGKLVELINLNLLHVE